MRRARPAVALVSSFATSFIVACGSSSDKPSAGASGASGASNMMGSSGSGALGPVGGAGVPSSDGSGAPGTSGGASGLGNAGSSAGGPPNGSAPVTPGWNNVVVGGGGFISGIAFHPAEAGLAYLRTDVGGAYRYDPAHARWIPINDNIVRAQADSLGILSLALDPSDPERVYLMTGKYTQSWAGTGAVLSSKDRGNTWARAELGFKVGGNEDGRGTGERLAVDPNQGAHLLMGSTKDGLWQSTDSGAAWQRVTAFTPVNVNFVLFDGASGKPGSPTPRIFVGTADNTQSVWLSLDAGASWKAVPGQPTGMSALRGALTGSTLYLTEANAVGPNGATAGAVAKLDTNTLAWSAASPPTGSYGFGGVSVDAKNPDHLLVSSLDRWYPHDELYQSTDGGKTFAPLLDSAIYDRSFAPYIKSSTPHWLTDARLDPFDSNHALFVTGYGLFSCTGLATPPVTCAFQDAGIEETVPIQIVAPPSGALLLSAMGDIDGFKHDSLDVSPPARYAPSVGTTLSIAFAEAAPVKVVKAYNVTPFGASSSDGGSTWAAFGSFPAGTTAGGAQSIALSADGASIVWSPVGGAPSRSVDQGKTWQAVTGLGKGLSAVADRVNASKFYALDALNGKVFVSTDGGASFTTGASGLPVLPDYQLSDGNLGPVFGQEGHVWLTLGANGLYRSMDSGKTFSKVNGPSAAFNIGVGKAKAGATYPALYVLETLGSSTGVFRSDDQGATFSEVTDEKHKFGIVHSIAGDRNVYGRVFLATEGRGIQYFSP